MVVRYGRSVEPGFLPIYSVDTEEEARQLLTLTCQTNLNGEFIAKELIQEQTLGNLYAFGDRLAEGHKMLKQRKKVKK